LTEPKLIYQLARHKNNNELVLPLTMINVMKLYWIVGIARGCRKSVETTIAQTDLINQAGQKTAIFWKSHDAQSPPGDSRDALLKQSGSQLVIKHTMRLPFVNITKKQSV
jgi:hypothetical protein